VDFGRGDRFGDREAPAVSRLLFGPRRAGPKRTEERQLHLPMGFMKPAGYADVDLSRAENSLQSVAVRASVDLISSLGSELPVDIVSGKGAQRREWDMPAHLEDPSGDGYGREDWVYQLLISFLLRGNAFGNVLERDRAGRPTQVDWWHPDTVSAQLDGGKVLWFVNGTKVPDGQMWHLRVNPIPGQVMGLSPIAAHAATIGLSLTSTQFGLQWFREGAHPSSLLTNEADLKDGQAKTAKERFMAAMRGNREPLVLGKGWKWQAIQLNPEESQFLETQGFSAAECARIFGPGMAEILGYESGGSLTYATVDGRMQHLLTLSVNKWLRRVERVMTAMVPAPRKALMDRDAMLQTTTLERYKAHESALRNRWKTVNDVRGDEDMASVAWGDKPNPTYTGISTSIAIDETDADPDVLPAGGNE
jgi:HK97 family phage portal protein